MDKFDERYRYLGPHQWRIVEVLKKNKQMTIVELASAIYKRPIKSNSKEYRSIAQSVQDLREKKIIDEKKPQGILWFLVEKT